MAQLKKHIWLIETLRRHGKISFKEISDMWERNKDMSDYEPLHRGTFNRWRKDILITLGIEIKCQESGGYLYYIANPDDINEDKLRHWILDTFSVGNLVQGNRSLKNRILVDEIPSGYLYLTPIMEAMRENRVLEMSYTSFRTGETKTDTVAPYCVKLFEGRWYMLAKPKTKDKLKIYGLDRIRSLTILNDMFKIPENFSAIEHFETMYGIVTDTQPPMRIILRAYAQHKEYLKSLPIHHSQRLIEDHGDYADFELWVAPTYDFIMRLLHDGAWLEVISPESVRKTMKGWIYDMYGHYEDM